MELTDQHIYRHTNTDYIFQATHPTADVWMMGRKLGERALSWSMLSY